MSNTREQDETNEIIEGKLAHLKYVLSSVDKHDAKVDGKPNDKFLDSIMALELNSMSFQERGLAYEEIHGVDDIVAETPEFVAEKLAALDEALFCIKNKPAYDQAVQANREYVKGHKFRLMFLRSERFNCEKAASRLVNFVEGKLQYFGPDSLGRPILFRDLDRDDVAALKTGYVQLLPSRDSAGRLIICAVATPIKSAKSMIKAYLYIMSRAAEDEETQRRGLVCVIYQIGELSSKFADFEIAREAPKTVHWLPLRISGVHMCVDNPLMKMFARILLAGSGRDFRAKHRLHEGTNVECQYSIMAYGISPDSLPVTSEGILKKGAHVKWVKKHQIRDSAQDGIEKIDVPGKNDVLLGKVGKSMQQHPGNVLLRTFVESKMPEYIRFEARDEKTSYMDNIVVAIRQSSFRFLKLDGQGWWVLATENDVREKISRAFTYAQSNWGKIQKKPEFSTQRAPPEVKRTKLNDEGCFGV